MNSARRQQRQNRSRVWIDVGVGQVAVGLEGVGQVGFRREGAGLVSGKTFQYQCCASRYDRVTRYICRLDTYSIANGLSPDSIANGLSPDNIANGLSPLPLLGFKVIGSVV